MFIIKILLLPFLILYKTIYTVEVMEYRYRMLERIMKKAIKKGESNK